MTKDDLIKEVASKVEVSDAEARRAVDATIKAMSASLSRGETILLRGLGSLNVVTRKPRMVRNITAGTSYLSEAIKTVKFIPSLAVKKALNA
jgi:nucleoid DNA-binding protein